MEELQLEPKDVGRQPDQFQFIQDIRKVMCAPSIHWHVRWCSMWLWRGVTTSNINAESGMSWPVAPSRWWESC